MKKTKINGTTLVSWSAPTRAEMYGSVELNPFYHLFEGAKNLFSTNLMPALVMAVIFFVLSRVISLPFNGAVRQWATSLTKSHAGHLLPMSHFLSALALYCLFAFLLYITLGQVVTRLVVTGVRLQSEDLWDACRVVMRRLGTTILTFLAVFGIVLMSWVATIVLLLLIPSLALLFFVAGLCAVVATMVHLMYVGPILADDTAGIHVGKALATSSRLWRASRGAVLCYIIPLFGVLFVIMIGAFSWLTSTGALQPNSPAYNQLVTSGQAAANGSLIGNLLGAVIESVIVLVLGAGMAHIYNRAKEYL